MPNNRARLHLFRAQLVPRAPIPHPLKGVDLDCIIVARRRDLPGTIERCVADAQPRLVLAHQSRQPRSLCTAQFSQVPHSHETVQACGRNKVWVSRVQAKTTNLLLRQFPDISFLRASISPSDVAI